MQDPSLCTSPTGGSPAGLQRLARLRPRGALILSLVLVAAAVVGSAYALTWYLVHDWLDRELGAWQHHDLLPLRLLEYKQASGVLTSTASARVGLDDGSWDGKAHVRIEQGLLAVDFSGQVEDTEGVLLSFDGWSRYELFQNRTRTRVSFSSAEAALRMQGLSIRVEIAPVKLALTQDADGTELTLTSKRIVAVVDAAPTFELRGFGLALALNPGVGASAPRGDLSARASSGRLRLEGLALTLQDLRLDAQGGPGDAQARLRLAEALNPGIPYVKISALDWSHELQLGRTTKPGDWSMSWRQQLSARSNLGLLSLDGLIVQGGRGGEEITAELSGRLPPGLVDLLVHLRPQQALWLQSRGILTTAGRHKGKIRVSIRPGDPVK